MCKLYKKIKNLKNFLFAIDKIHRVGYTVHTRRKAKEVSPMYK